MVSEGNAGLSAGSLVAGRYQILRQLGRGGMGTVYVAEQRPLQRRVALKVLGSKSDGEARERFVREARAASRLQHPNIATVYDFGSAESGPYLAMELIEGSTLREILNESRRLPWERAHVLATQIARGLAAAHHQGIVHRDVKPENLIVTATGDEEQVKILDFGLANLVSSVDASLTQSGFVMGSAGYISPEQLDGITNDVRSDLYALGVILFEMLAGQHPFSGKTAASLAIAHATKSPRRLADVTSDVPLSFCLLVDRLLSKNAADRPADGGALVSALGAILDTPGEITAANETGSRWHGMVEDHAPRGSITLAFTDIEGSTSMWDREPRAMRQALDAHNAIIRDLIGVHHGYEVKTQGDSFLVAFASNHAAVEWCLAVQRALLRHAWPAEIARGVADRLEGNEGERRPGLRVRMGLHTGEPDCRRNPITGRMDYFGPVVNLASRIESAAHGGQILVSAAIAESISKHLGALRASLRPRGEHTLKGVAAPEMLIEVVDETATWKSFPPPRTERKAVRTNLTDEHSVFVGRASELDRIDEAFGEGSRLVTVLGPGGTGKTRLSRVAARRQQGRDHGPVEIWFCDLSAANNPTAIVAIVSEILSIPLAGGAEFSDAVDLVGRALSRRGHVFLVLDNLEQIVEEVSEPIAAWLGRCPELRILATSREALGLPGEARLELDPLDEEGGIALFEARVKELGRPPTGEREIVRQLVIALDGMPLAIELAASRIALMKPQQILERLSRRFDLLKGTRRGVGARQATLRGAIDWSWDLLSEVERVAFAQLSIFEGGFSIEAAEEVLDLSAFDDAPYVLDIVQALKDKSLLRTAPSQGHDLRLAMLKSIQEYAAGKLAATPGAAVAAQERHANFFIREGLRVAKATRTSEKQDAMAWLAANRQNLFTICHRTHAHAPAQAIAAAIALQPLLAERDPTEPHRRQLASAEAWARGLGDDAALAEVLIHRAELELEKGVASQAQAAAEEARDLTSATHAPDLHVAALIGYARTLHRLGRGSECDAVLDDAESIARSLGDPLVMARILNLRGVLAFSTRVAEQPYLKDALRMARKCGDPNIEARVLGNMGIENMIIGRLEEARDAMMQALELHRTHRSRALEGLTMGNIGTVSLTIGDLDASERWLRGAIAVHQELGNTLLEGADQSHLARTLVEGARIHEAIALATNALDLIESASGARERLMCLCNLAVAHAYLDQPERATELLDSAQKTSYEWNTREELFDTTRAHIDLARARAAGGAVDDERVTNAKALLERLRANSSRLFLPLRSLELCVKHYPNPAPVRDRPISDR